MPLLIFCKEVLKMESIFSYSGDGAFFRSILEVLFNSFFHRCKEIYFFVNMKTPLSGLFFFSLFLHIIFIISIIRVAMGNKLSFFFTFILCFSLPSLAAFAIVFLIGDRTEELKNELQPSPKKATANREEKICENCGKKIWADSKECFFCKHKFFENEKDKDKIVI
jgi:uncharacterized paraquat-inducible protein A